MATTTATHGLRMPAGNPQPIVIEENSGAMKVLSYVPFIGIIPSLIQENSLGKKIINTTEVPRLVELINVKNQYKIANAVRCLLEAVLIIVGIASGILSGPLAFGILASSPLLAGVISTILLTGIAGLNIYNMNKNNKIIVELHSTGFRPGMIVA
jgi:hypothetical protein